jgi:hypothetical protein
MATGRTVGKWVRPYINGFEMSGFSNNIGPLGVTYAEAEQTQFSDALQGFLPAVGDVEDVTINGMFDNTASTSMHANFSSSDALRNVMVAIGIRAEPAQGDPVYVLQARQLTYTATPGGPQDPTTVTMKLAGWDVSGTSLLYALPFGVLLRPKSAATTGVNAASGVDDYGAATAFGGVFAYQVFAGNGTATLSVDDSADNSAFLALSGATSGSIDCSTPKSGIVALGTSATVRRYLRWQIALGTATTVTAAWAFIRAFHN